MNLFGNESWNGPGSIFASRRRARATPNITVRQVNAAEEREGRHLAPPRDWPSDDEEAEEDGEEGGHTRLAPPPIPVCQEFVYDPIPPAAPPGGGEPATLSGFEQGAWVGGAKRAAPPFEEEGAVVDDIMSDLERGRGSPYFANKRAEERPPPSKRARTGEPSAGLEALRRLRQSEGEEERPGFAISTDCCREIDGAPLYDETLGGAVPEDPTRVWCFGCQWGAHNHGPLDNAKVSDLVECFMSMILNGSTTLENTARLVSDMYRRTIQDPARAQGQCLPDWPPAVVRRHIENMTEPRIRNALLLRKNLALLDVVFENSVRVNSQSGQREVNMQACNMWCRLLRETREMYRQVPKDSFGYNPQFRADSWNGSTLVHPTRVQRLPRPDEGNGGADIRKYVMGSGVVDSGVPRGPGNDEELVSRPVGGTLSAESGC